MRVQYVVGLIAIVLSMGARGGLVAGADAPDQAAPAAPATAAQARGELFRTDIETAERDLMQAMADSFTTLEQSLQEVNSKAQSVQPEAIALNALRALVKELHAQGQMVLDSQRTFVASASTFADRLTQGPERFRAMATEFRAFAAAETYAELAGDYRGTAATFDALAQRCEAQLRRLQPSIAEYRENLGYIERSLLFLARLDNALATVPDLAEFDRLDASLAQLARYVHGFERLRGSLHEFDKRLHAPADSQNSAPRQPPATEADQATASRRF